MLRKITKEDLPFARKLRNDNKEYFFDPFKIDKQTHLAWFTASQLDPDFEFYIIWEGKKRVGTISAHATMELVEIGNIIIDKKYRKKGYFAKALEEILGLYSDKLAFLKVIPSNKTAIKAYKALGFQEKERTLWI
jgi:RimJ/RimL family protein N-acetyltransferase